MARKESDKTDNRKSNSVWSKTSVPNLIRYEPKGTYYLRARVNGRIVRESLKLTDFAAAKIKVSERLAELRLAGGGTPGVAPKSLIEALAVLRTQVESTPSIKKSTRELYLKEIKRLMTEGQAKVPTTQLLRLTRQEMEEWWKRVTAIYRPTSSNHLLQLVRRAIKLAHDAGGILKDPTEKIKPMRIGRTRLDLPTHAQFKAIVESIRAQKHSDHWNESSNWVEFMAYSGMRPGEIRHVKWEHVHDHQGIIMVHGGLEGTKNRESRPVPIIPPMADLLSRMRNGETKSGLIFSINKPTKAFQNACKRVGVPPQRLYNLRHLFATTCRDSGVPVPTFAQWLGHKDGGALAMRTYVQNNDEHSQKAAKLVKFGS